MFYSNFCKNPNSFYAEVILIIMTLLIDPIAYAASSDCASPTVKTTTITTMPNGQFRITGTISFNGDPLCGLVLANGQFMFTCGDPLPKGNFDLTIPLDNQGQITLFGFSAGLVPFQQTIGAGSLPTAAGNCTTPWLMVKTITTMPNGYFKIAGTIELNGTSLCGLVLANGQFMFTCGDPLPKGNFDLTVPPDDQGKITLFGFSAGLVPFQRTFSPSSPFSLTAGSWSGEHICFNVSPDGSKLTKEGSLCTGNGSTTGAIDEGKVVDSASIVAHYADGSSTYTVLDIPIINDAFDAKWVKGIFASSITASGIANIYKSINSINWDASKPESIRPIPGKWSGQTSDGGSVCFYVSSDSFRLTQGGCAVLSTIIHCAFGVFPPNKNSPTCPGSFDLQIVNNFFWGSVVVAGQFTSPRSASGTALHYGSSNRVSWTASPGY